MASKFARIGYHALSAIMNAMSTTPDLRTKPALCGSVLVLIQ